MIAGRALSVLFGVVTVAALAGALHVIGRTFGGRRDEPMVVALLALIVPFLVFSDRIARPDSLFALETVLAAGLSLVLVTRARPIGAAVAFGLLMGLTMLTRQAVSYPLWLLPPIAAVCVGRRDWKRLAGPFALSLAFGVALWFPLLFAPGWPDLSTRLFHLGISRPALPIGERTALVARNLGTAVAAFWTYLTPPVFLASVAGIVFLAVARRRLFAFLASWFLLILLPTAVFAVDWFPRYAIPAVAPLLAAAGIGIAYAWSRSGRGVRIAALVALVAWPAFAVARGLSDWREWPYLAVDRRQFVSGWSAGSASERAAAFLSAESRSGPITVVVPHVSGNPSDAVWLRLEGTPNVRLLYAEDFLTRPAIRVKGDVWTDQPPATIPARGPAYLVSPDPVFLGRGGWAPARRVVAPLNPDARVVTRFENPPDENGRVESAVVLYRLR